MTFTYDGLQFEARENEANKIVWLQGYPNESWSMPRSFTFQEVAQQFIDEFCEDLSDDYLTMLDYTHN